jgi:hypothetical protein
LGWLDGVEDCGGGEVCCLSVVEMGGWDEISSSVSGEPCRVIVVRRRSLRRSGACIGQQQKKEKTRVADPTSAEYFRYVSFFSKSSTTLKSEAGPRVLANMEYMPGPKIARGELALEEMEVKLSQT